MARIGVDMGGTKLEAIVLDTDGSIRARKRVATPETYEDKIRAIAGLVKSVEAESGLTRLPVGVGHPGSINPKSGLVRNANSTDLNGQKLDMDLSSQILPFGTTRVW